ncbi:hypothetical protein Q8A67_023622 [Cirrhinus molitorella]|uniref:Ig-like domain-containing protein n=1 Tax=Cirrhinus molitorella TaxID=172907 RepID=A0AA88P643_9TELE|nr:hypothetical protein Q8A67_023622 [Cirrhinus molitorella]
MILSKCNAVITCAWMLLSLFSVAGHALFNSSSVQTVHRGMSVNISCNYQPINDSDGLTMELQTANSKLCSVMKSNKLWINQSCRDHCRFIWIPETVQMAFEVSNLQINDTGIYKCAVSKIIPPPSQLLGEEETFVQVIAQPNVFVSHERALGGFLTVVCRSEGFYPSALEQMWMRNGEFQNASLIYSINKTNSDGSFTFLSYLNISDCVNYSCWVNHSSLSQPTIYHMSSTDCYGNKDTNKWIALVTSALLILTILMITIVCERYRRGRQSSVSPVGLSVTSELGLYDDLQTEILYSTLGDHYPVPAFAHSFAQ